ncbi:MAG: glycosyltransferase [Desulfovermiculus sp.]|nr:glycosyltransferase [Desulfovermiculus sp.]
MTDIQLSVIVPIYNEEQNIPELYSRITQVLSGMDSSYEIITVDDGSSDHSLQALLDLHHRDSRLRVVQLMRNYGQHPALAAGFSQAKGQIVLTIDSDLQIEPSFIPQLVHKLGEGYDFVSGVRKGSGDSFWWRRVPSKMVNALICKVVGKRLRDYGCPLNAMNCRIARMLTEYGEQQRFFKPLAVSLAENIAEVEVEHSPREKGQSKYRFMSLMELFFDFLTNFSRHVFQKTTVIGVLLTVVTIVSGCLYLVLRFVFPIIDQPVPRVQVLILFLFIFGLQLSILGFLGEFVMRIYKNIQHKPIYSIKKIW